MTEVVRGGISVAGSEVEIISGTTRVSWGAIFGGVVMAVAVQLLLALLGIGIGLTTIDPQQGAAGTPSASDFSIGAGIWWTVSNLVALFIGGFVAARLAGVVQGRDGMLHGLITWGFSLILTFFLLTSAMGSILGGAFNALQGVSQGARAVSDQGMAGALGLSSEQLMQGVDRLIAGQANSSPEQVAQARGELIGLVPRLAQGGEAASQAADEAVRIVARARNVPPQEVEAEVNQALTQAREKTAEVANDAANAAATAAITGFVALLLGAIAAALGGHRGARLHQDSAALRL